MESSGIIAAGVRMSAFFNHDPLGDTTCNLLHHLVRIPSDFKTGTGVPLETWSTMEPGFYLIAACLPSLRPLLIQIIHLVRTHKAYNSSDKPGHWPNSIADRNKQFRRLEGVSYADFSQPKIKTVCLGGEADAADLEAAGIPLNSINMAREVHVSTEASSKGAER